MWESLNACVFLKSTWTQTLINPDPTAKFSLCSPLHITWLQVFFHCFALFRLCYGPKSTWISAFLWGWGCSSSICFHCATYSPWTTALSTNSFVLLRSETDLWHTALPSLSDSSSAQITRPGLLWQTYSHPCPSPTWDHFCSVLAPAPVCQGYFHAQGNRASKCWKGAKASSGQVINHSVRGMHVESKLHTKIQPGEFQADYHQTFPKDVLCWLNHNELIRWVSTRYIYKGNGPLCRTWFKSDMRPVPQLLNALTI